MPRYQEDSEREEWNRKSVPSDEAVEEETDSVVSAQGRERQNALRGDVELEVGNSFDFLPAPSRNARLHENSKNKEQPPGVYTARTRREQSASRGRRAAENNDHYLRPPASNWREEAAVHADDRQAHASSWREPRQPTASIWREAASVGQRQERLFMQRPIVVTEDEQQDRCSGRPEHASREPPDRYYGKDHAERRPRRSLSADYGDRSKDHRYVDHQNQRTGVTVLDNRRVDQFVVMPRFDGTGDLELFLQRFRTLADYYGWSNSEQLFRLQNSIQGDAQYLLLDIEHLNDAREFIDALKARFGTSAHAERYRTELSQLRRGTLTIEQLYLKVRSLVSKAAPGSWSALTEIYARDAFLTALDDDKLKRRIMLTSPPPETLVAVYDLALRAVAVENYVIRSRSESRRDRHPPQYGQSKHARMVEAEHGSEPDTMVTQQMKQFMEQLKEIQAAVMGLKASTEKQPEEKVNRKGLDVKRRIN
jgi:hypothetical protein